MAANLFHSIRSNRAVAAVPLFKFDLEATKWILHDKFEELVQLGKNDEVKCFVTSFASVYSSCIADDNGVTLLHLAAKYNNIALIEFSLGSGHEIDVKNSLGETPLFVALSSNHIEVITTLLDANANVWINEAERVLKLLIAKRETLTDSILARLMQDYVKGRSCEDLENIAVLLAKVNCPLLFVVYVNNAHLTRIMLEITDYETNDEELVEVLHYVTRKVDLENLRVIWRSTCAIEARNNYLNQILIPHSFPFVPPTWHPNNWKYMRPLFEHLSEWMIFDMFDNEFVTNVFRSADKQELLVLLHHYNVDVQLRKSFNFEAIPLIFENKKLNAKDLFELVHNRQFDVNKALHGAAWCGLESHVRVLLEWGADCNAKNEFGRTPLFSANSHECIEVLLRNGADLHVPNEYGVTLLEKYLGDNGDRWLFNQRIVEVLLAQLAIDYYRDVRMKQVHLDRMNKCRYETYLDQVKLLMNYEIVPSSLTLFDVIVKKSKNLSYYVRSRETLCSVMKWCSRQCLHSHYRFTLKVILQNAYDVHRAKCRIAKIISKSLLNPISFDHLVIDRICDFLSRKDILSLVRDI